MTLERLLCIARTRWTAATRGLRRISGMPDYPAYLEHLRTHHPGCPLPTEREYFEDYLKGRYGAGFGRCC